MTERWDRRAILAALGTAGTSLLAGCQSDDDTSGGTNHVVESSANATASETARAEAPAESDSPTISTSILSAKRTSPFETRCRPLSWKRISRSSAPSL